MRKNRISAIAAAFVLVLAIAAGSFTMTFAQQTSGYEPSNIMLTPGPNISWINPTNTLSQVSLYLVSAEGETLLADGLSKAPGAVKYTYTGAFKENDTGNFKLHFGFADGAVRDIYFSGKLKTTNVGNMLFDESGRLYIQNSQTFLQTGRIVYADSGNGVSGNRAFYFQSNEAASSTADNMSRFWFALPSGTFPTGEYMLSFKAKATADFTLRASEANIKRHDFSITKSDEWQTYSSKVVFRDGTKNNLRLIAIGLQGELWLDDILFTNSQGENIFNVDFETPSLSEALNAPTDNGSAGGVYCADIRWIADTAADYVRVYEKDGAELILRARVPSANGAVTLNGLEANREYTFALTNEVSVETRSGSAAESAAAEVVCTPLLPEYEATLELSDGSSAVEGITAGNTYTARAAVKNNRLSDLKGQLIVILEKDGSFYKSWITNSEAVNNGDTKTLLVQNISIPRQTAEQEAGQTDPSEYRLRLMLWNDVLGNMQRLHNCREYSTSVLQN